MNQLPPNKGPELRQIYFYVSEGCNCACRHCWLAPKFDPQGQRPMLPHDLFSVVLEEARPLGLAGVKLTGGEPLLNPHLNEMIRLTHKVGLRIALETNGLLLTPGVAALLTQGPSFVSVSLDGVDPQTLAWIRGMPEAYELTVKGIECLVRAGIRPQIIMSLFRRNRDQVEPLIRLAERLGAASVKFNLIQPTARGQALHEAVETPGVTELIALGRWIETELADSAKLPLHFDWPPAFKSLSRLASEGNLVCGLRGIIGVLPTGEYALCGIGQSMPEMVFGRAGQDRLAQVWAENETLKRIRAGLPGSLTGICGKCLMKGRCLGKCVAQNYYRGRDIFAPFWFCDRAEAEGQFPASRLVPKPI